MDAGFVLLVEDNPDDVFFTLRELRRHNSHIRTHVIDHGQDAVEFVRDCSEVPDLILLDYRLPAASAPDILKELRSHGELTDVPVLVMLSGGSEFDRLDELLCAEGATACIAKPVRYEDIVVYLGPSIAA